MISNEWIYMTKFTTTTNLVQRIRCTAVSRMPRQIVFICAYLVSSHRKTYRQKDNNGTTIEKARLLGSCILLCSNHIVQFASNPITSNDKPHFMHMRLSFVFSHLDQR